MSLIVKRIKRTFKVESFYRNRYQSTLFLGKNIETCYSKWFEPRSICSLSSVIVRVSVDLKRNIVDSD